ncbi:hypothetical protein H2199_003007 [Coniosporium tulheliwenetii]|uniref:Uncharacterized protein n=1 Tax=Coniosporium tulheliwenetii TaxID=3383036 RepID=A0ACC2ZF50_9PEZI|nr:hypothetical protein H2199_003007 [Cladosporium sp. JES 115]
MAKRGVHYEDLLPVPTEGMAPTEPDKKERSTSMAEGPTLSHALAQNHTDHGAVSLSDEGAEVVDLGWNEPPEKIPKPLVGGLPNEELWLLVRRFNKQVYHVKETLHPPPGGLDMYIADEEEFSPDKLRSNIERLYMTIGVGLMGFWKHIVRLRSWRETRRTAWFCTAYFLAWMFDFLVPLFSLALIALIAYPPSRDGSGGVQKPKAGVLGSHDSATGAPENHKGEAVENEASNFVNSIAAVAISSASGKHPQNEPDDEKGTAQDSVPDPTALAVGAANAKDKADGKSTSATHDKTKVPMETAMWTKMRPVMHGLGVLTDTWERFANALEPTPPFPKDLHRLRLAAVVLPMFAGSIFISSYMFMKGVTFGAGFGFFGDPIIRRGLEWLNKNYPNWMKLLELRKYVSSLLRTLSSIINPLHSNILRGVPTNAQLTITLLRIGEANHAPLPPPPRTSAPPPQESAEVSEKNLRATGADYP